MSTIHLVEGDVLRFEAGPPTDREDDGIRMVHPDFRVVVPTGSRLVGGLVVHPRWRPRMPRTDWRYLGRNHA